MKRVAAAAVAEERCFIIITISYFYRRKGQLKLSGRVRVKLNFVPSSPATILQFDCIHSAPNLLCVQCKRLLAAVVANVIIPLLHTRNV